MEKYLQRRADNLKTEEDLIYQLNLELQDNAEKFERRQDQMKLQWLNTKRVILDRIAALNRREAKLCQREMAVSKEGEMEQARRSTEITDDFSAIPEWRPRLTSSHSDSDLAGGAGSRAVSSVHAAKLVRFLRGRSGGRDEGSLHLPLFTRPPSPVKVEQ